MIATIFGAVAFFPVNTIFVNSPVAYTSYTGFGHRSATSNNLAPSTVPWKRLMLKVIDIIKHTQLLQFNKQQIYIDETKNFKIDFSVGML